MLILFQNSLMSQTLILKYSLSPEFTEVLNPCYSCQQASSKQCKTGYGSLLQPGTTERPCWLCNCKQLLRSCLLLKALQIAESGSALLNTKYKSKTNNKGFFALLLVGKGVIGPRIRQWYYFVGREKLSRELLDEKKKIPQIRRMLVETYLLYQSGKSLG